MFLSLFCLVDLQTSNCLMPAFGELMMLNRLLIEPGVEHAMRNIGVNLCLLVLRPRGSMVLPWCWGLWCAHNEHTRNNRKLSTCSHKWWETLKGSIFGVKPSIPALRWPGGSLVVTPAEKASLLGSQFDSRQCREQFVTPLSCFPQ